jgi:hypothetical protein
MTRRRGVGAGLTRIRLVDFCQTQEQLDPTVLADLVAHCYVLEGEDSE